MDIYETLKDVSDVLDILNFRIKSVGEPIDELEGGLMYPPFTLEFDGDVIDVMFLNTWIWGSDLAEEIFPEGSDLESFLIGQAKGHLGYIKQVNRKIIKWQ